MPHHSEIVSGGMVASDGLENEAVESKALVVLTYNDGEGYGP